MINSVWWVGVVENRIDPLKLGRCQVRIFGHHTENKQELKTEDLPWAHPVLPLNNPNPYAPKEGETVTGFFMDGEDAQFPIMMGVLSGIPVRKANETLGFNDPRTAAQLNTAPVKPEVFGESLSKYPRAIDEPTTPRAARNESMDKSQFKQKMNNVISGSPESPKKPKTVYPYNNVYESESGHLFEMDDTPKDERIQLFHRSGSYFEYAADGSVTEKVQAKKSETVRAGSTLYVGENLTVIVKGNANYQVDGDFSISCKNFSLSAKEAIGMSAGKSASLSAKEDVGISAKKNITGSAQINMALISKAGNMDLSAKVGNMSLSAKGLGTFSSDGALILESKAVSCLFGPTVLIGMGGGAALGEVGDTALESMDKSLLDKIGEATAGAISETAGSFFSSTFESLGGFTEGLAGGLSDLAGFSGADFFGGLSDTLSQGGILGELTTGLGDAFSGLTSFSGLSDAFSSITESLSSGSLMDVIGTVKDAISDPLGTILNSDAFSTVMGDLADGLGESFSNFMGDFSFGSDGLGGGFSFDSLKEGFNIAKDLYQTGISIVNDPLGALSSLGGAADIFSQGSGGFLDGLKEAAFAANDFLNSGSSLIGQTFNDIQSALNLNINSTNSAIGSIEPLFNSFLDVAQQAVFDSMPNVDGLSSVLNRVSDTLSADDNFKFSIVNMVKTGKENGLNNSEIASGLQNYMNSTYMNSAQQEMRNSPITFLNLVDSTA